MKPLYSELQYQNSKSKDKLPCECEICHEVFYVFKHQIMRSFLDNPMSRNNFCSQKCNGISKIKRVEVKCLNCEKTFYKTLSSVKKSPNHFCCKSCSTSYNNTHKKHGTRRSKLEKYIEEKLTKKYEFSIQYNQKEIINSELDIYIPLLKLAFELNGIFHYEPIFGIEKLEQIVNNDNRKFQFQACLEKNIELCIIDTSSLIYFKESNVVKFLNIITNIIDNKYSQYVKEQLKVRIEGFEPPMS